MQRREDRGPGGGSRVLVAAGLVLAMVTSACGDDSGSPFSTTALATSQGTTHTSVVATPTTVEETSRDGSEDAVDTVLAAAGLAREDVPVERITYNEDADDPWLGRVEFGPNPADVDFVDLWADPSGAADRLVLHARTISGDTTVIVLDARAETVQIEVPDGSVVTAVRHGDDVEVTTVSPEGEATTETSPAVDLDPEGAPEALGTPGRSAGRNLDAEEPLLEPWPVEVHATVLVPYEVLPEDHPDRARAWVLGTCSQRGAVACSATGRNGHIRVNARYGLSEATAYDRPPVYRTPKACEAARSSTDRWVAWGTFSGGGVAGVVGLLVKGAAGWAFLAATGIAAVGLAYSETTVDCGSVPIGTDIRSKLAQEAANHSVGVTATGGPRQLGYSQRSDTAYVWPFRGGRHQPPGIRDENAPREGSLELILGVDESGSGATSSTIPSTEALAMAEGVYRIDADSVAVALGPQIEQFESATGRIRITSEREVSGSFVLRYSATAGSAREPYLADVTADSRLMRSPLLATDDGIVFTGRVIQIIEWVDPNLGSPISSEATWVVTGSVDVESGRLELTLRSETGSETAIVFQR